MTRRITEWKIMILRQLLQTHQMKTNSLTSLHSNSLCLKAFSTVLFITKSSSRKEFVWRTHHRLTTASASVDFAFRSTYHKILNCFVFDRTMPYKIHAYACSLPCIVWSSLNSFIPIYWKLVLSIFRQSADINNHLKLPRRDIPNKCCCRRTFSFFFLAIFKTLSYFLDLPRAPDTVVLLCCCVVEAAMAFILKFGRSTVNDAHGEEMRCSCKYWAKVCSRLIVTA